MAFDTDVNEGVEDHSEDTPLDKTETVAETTDEVKAEPAVDSQDNDDADTKGEDKPEGDEPDGETEPEKKPSRASDRIKQLVAEKKAMEAELEQVRQQSQQPKQKQITSDDGEPVKPRVEDYDLETQLDEYFEALGEYDEKHQDWKLDQRLKQREQSKQQEQRNAEITSTFNERFKANPKFKDDFQQLTKLFEDKPIAADPSELYAGDDLMDILEHIAADQDLYYEIADMPEKRQYAEFGRIHAQIQSRKSAPKTARQSKAPPPPNHTKANAPAKRSPYSGSDDDFLAARGL